MMVKLKFVLNSFLCFLSFHPFVLAQDISLSISSKKMTPGTLERVILEVPSNSQKNNEPNLIQGNFENQKLNFYLVEEIKDQETNLKKIYNALLPIPYHQKHGDYQISVQIEDKQIQSSIQIIPGHYGSEILKVKPKHVNPGKKALARIIKEQRQIKKIYEIFTEKKYWTGPFVLPIEDLITSPFGTRRVYNGSLKNFHTGTDLRAAVGTPIYAAAAGKVVLSEDLYYTGNTVLIDHGYCLITLYGHMSELKVKVGDEVTAKQLIGNSGATGRVNGPHLHWQAVIQGVKVNPQGLLNIL